jgi:hypothetical protein
MTICGQRTDAARWLPFIDYLLGFEVSAIFGIMSGPC